MEKKEKVCKWTIDSLIAKYDGYFILVICQKPFFAGVSHIQAMSYKYCPFCGNKIKVLTK